mmetsp:Transcript_47383/g.88789  ORF Transcript_47383/g.88789 Transcript_47383/m.88789 type:complete len:222 (+) Transcript_47383:114-779(+)
MLGTDEMRQLPGKRRELDAQVIQVVPRQSQHLCVGHSADCVGVHLLHEECASSDESGWQHQEARVVTVVFVKRLFPVPGGCQLYVQLSADQEVNRSCHLALLDDNVSRSGDDTICHDASVCQHTAGSRLEEGVLLQHALVQVHLQLCPQPWRQPFHHLESSNLQVLSNFELELQVAFHLGPDCGRRLARVHEFLEIAHELMLLLLFLVYLVKCHHDLRDHC